MAKKHTDTETTAKSLKDIFESVDALNADASLLSEENSLSIVSDWIDTGSCALNAIFSGSVYTMRSTVRRSVRFPVLDWITRRCWNMQKRTAAMHCAK